MQISLMSVPMTKIVARPYAPSDRTFSSYTASPAASIPWPYFVRFAATQPVLSQPDQAFLKQVETTVTEFNTQYMRAHYLFLTAMLSKELNSEGIFSRFPLLSAPNTVKRLNRLHQQHPTSEGIKRLFLEVLDSYVKKQTAAESDAVMKNIKELKIDLTGHGLFNRKGQLVTQIAFQETADLYVVTGEKSKREALQAAINTAYTEKVSPSFIALQQKQKQVLHDLGYSDLIAFYSDAKGYPLPKLGEQAEQLIQQTEALYRPRFKTLYEDKIGGSVSQASASDYAFLFDGKSDTLATVEKHFPVENLLPLVRATLDQLGLQYNQRSQEINPQSLAEYEQLIQNLDGKRPILLDIVDRTGKRARAYHAPARIGLESYLSLKPAPGKAACASLLHESGHALHRTGTNKDLGIVQGLLGDKAVTESYAFLLQNLFLNKDWLVHQAKLPEKMATQLIQEGAMQDLLLLRRYAAKLLFELQLFDGSSLAGKPELYAQLQTRATGFQYQPERWTRDIDPGFYVADYFTAWVLEAQLRDYLERYYGGEAWYQNPAAGKFLQGLWAQGNINPEELSDQLMDPNTRQPCYKGPTDVEPLLRLMKQNLNR